MEPEQCVIHQDVEEVEPAEADDRRAGEGSRGERDVGPAFGPPDDARADPRDDHHPDREQAVGQYVRPEPVERVHRVDRRNEVVPLEDVMEQENVDQAAEPEPEDPGPEECARRHSIGRLARSIR